MSERVAQLSILDRLMDSTADSAAMTWGQSVRFLKERVRYDIECLLNTRRTAKVVPPELSDLADSVYTYGLPDLSSAKAGADAKAWLCDQIRAAIERFEPRLSKVRVANVETEEGEVVRGLHFQITGTLNTYPAPQTVQFGTFLEVAQSEFAVEYHE